MTSGVGAGGASTRPKVLVYPKFGKITKKLGKEVATFFNNIIEIIFCWSALCHKKTHQIT